MIGNFLWATAAAAVSPFSSAAADAVAAPAAAPSAAEADSGGGNAPVPGNAAKAHEREGDEAIVITGTRRPGADVLGAVSVLDQEELAHDMKPSLGDTLADLPGVSATSFGPSSSRPILRGLSGERDAILIDGISSLNLSATDPDHAVTRAAMRASSRIMHP